MECLNYDGLAYFKGKLDSEISATLIVDSTSGTIASFPDGADGIPIKALTVGIEPVQDLHGYDNPWPAGGGANIYNGEYESGYWDISTGNAGSGGSWGRSKTPILCSPSTSYRFITNVTTAQGGLGYILYYDVYGNYLNSNTQINSAIYSGGGQVFSTPANCHQIKFYANIAWFTNAQICIELSTVTGFHPYANICPISGWTGANVYRTGKNLFDISLLSATNITVADGVASGTAGTFSTNFAYGIPNLILPSNCQLTISFQAKTDANSAEENTNGLSVAFDYTDGTHTRIYVKNNVTTYGNYSIVSDSSKEVSGVAISFSAKGQNIWHIKNMQIEVGSAASAFEAYTGTTLPISWQSTAGTVYGGSITLNEDGSADIVPTMVEVDAGTLKWTKGSFGSPAYSAFTCDAISDKANNFNFVCDHYKAVEKVRTGLNNCEAGLYHNSGNYWKRIVIRDDNYANSDATAFKAAMSGVKIVYELATPASAIHISNVSQLTTLLGANNIWADCGDITDLEYVADTKLYIDNKIATAIANALNA